MKLVTYLNKSEEDSLRLLNFDFLLVNSSKKKKKVQCMSSNYNESDDADCLNQRRR